LHIAIVPVVHLGTELSIYRDSSGGICVAGT